MACYYPRRGDLYSQIYENKSNVKSVVSGFRECVSGVIKILNSKPSAFRVVGLDCEFHSDSQKGGQQVPATLQLAIPDGFCIIVQLAVIDKAEKSIDSLFYRLKQSALKPLVQILEDPSILKVGVNVTNDAKHLYESYGFLCKGCLEVQYMAEELGFQPRGLDYLANEILYSKKKNLKQREKWESEDLPDNQLEYAAHDARLSVDLFMLLNKIAIEKCYSRVNWASWSDKTYWKHSYRLWEKYIGINFVLNKEENKSRCTQWTTTIPTKYYQGPFRYSIPEGALYCDICGKPNDVRKKAIVPEDYNIESRVDMPLYLDLCKSCFTKSHEMDYLVREELTEECGAPRPEYNHPKLKQAKSLCSDVKHVSSRKQSDEKHLCELIGLPDTHLNSVSVQTILVMDCWPGSAHGQFVHDYYERFHPDGLVGLRHLWCRKFLVAMKDTISMAMWSHYTKLWRISY